MYCYLLFQYLITIVRVYYFLWFCDHFDYSKGYFHILIFNLSNSAIVLSSAVFFRYFNFPFFMLIFLSCIQPYNLWEYHYCYFQVICGMIVIALSLFHFPYDFASFDQFYSYCFLKISYF